MKKGILVVFLMALFGVLIFAGGASAARKSEVPLISPYIDGGQPPAQYGGSSPVVYENSMQTDCEDINPSMGMGYIEQIDEWGDTWYDYQKNGSMGRMIAVGPGGHRHVVCHYSAGVYPANPRFIQYNCKNASDLWLGPTIITAAGKNAGYTNVDVLHNGREVVIFHETAPTVGAWATTLAFGSGVGFICSGGGYTTYRYDIPDWFEGGTEEGMWPKHGVVYDANVDTNYVHIVMTEGKTTGGSQRLGYLRCHLIAGDKLLCRTPNNGAQGVTADPIVITQNQSSGGTFSKIGYFGECEATGVPAGEFPNTISAVVATHPVSKKLAIVFTNKRESGTSQVNNDVFYFESTNNGVEWFPQFVPAGTWPPTLANGMLKNITNYATTATERAYTDVAACYDYNCNLHIVWTGCWYDSAAGLISNDVNLYHWSQATGTDMIAPGYWDDATPGAWNRNISKMSISAKDPSYHPGGTPDSVYLFATWTQFNPNDLSLGGFTNGEIYAAVSKTGGDTWTPGFNITGTNTDDCAAGACLSEHWSSLAKNMAEGDLHISYVCDRDAGGPIQDEGAWTANPMVYVHVSQLPSVTACGFAYTYVEPASFDRPPVKVLPTTPEIVRFKVSGIYNLGGNCQVTDNHPKVSVAPAGQFALNPGESQEIQVTINCGGATEFINAKLSIHGCIGTAQDTTIDLTLYAVCSNDYYECDRDPLTDIVKDNCKLKLWACVNCEEVVWDKRVVLNDPDDTHQVIFTAGAIIATTAGSDTIVGRQDYRDIYTGARDTINHVQSTIRHPLEEPECIIQKIHVKNTYIWYPKVINPTTSDIRWWWIDLHKQIIFFEDRTGFTCPEWKKEQVIKYYWITKSDPPAWWPNPGTYPGHEDIYFGVFADLDAPFDTGCYVPPENKSQTGCNSAGWDDTRKLIYQSGYYNGLPAPGGHPDYANHYVGMALTDPTGAVVSPYGMQDVRNDSFLYPNQGWGWKDKELYKLAATPGANIHSPGVICDRTVVMTAKKILAADPIPAEFILIEASITTGLAALQTHIDETRSVLIPEINTLGLFGKSFPICGDCTADGIVNSADVIGLLNYLYRPDHPVPKWPVNRVDVTGDKVVNSADVIGLLNYLYRPDHPKLNCSGFGR